MLERNCARVESQSSFGSDRSRRMSGWGVESLTAPKTGGCPLCSDTLADYGPADDSRRYRPQKWVSYASCCHTRCPLPRFPWTGSLLCVYVPSASAAAQLNLRCSLLHQLSKLPPEGPALTFPPYNVQSSSDQAAGPSSIYTVVTQFACS